MSIIGVRTGWRILAVLCLHAVLCHPAIGAAPELPKHLPRYKLIADLDVEHHLVRARLEATWTNPSATTATNRLLFNAHSRYVVPADQIGFTAKMLEILRMAPSDAMGIKVPPLVVDRITHDGYELKFDYEGDTKTILAVPLPRPVGPGESITVTLEITFRLSPKQGRYGQWEGVTTLSNWLPVFSYFGPKVVTGRIGAADEPRPTTAEWQPATCVPWHQPFFNESSIYNVTLTLPKGEHLACTGTVLKTTPIDNGREQVEIEARGVRDFAILCSARYETYEGVAKAGPGGAPVRVHVRAFKEHEFYAKHMIAIAIDALEKYSKWLGPYPWADFTIAESFFGWNGNECATLVMIDQRIFGMPHVGVGYVEHLVSHEICHQWWYNLIGTNGYCETWMDEGMATYFSNRYLNEKVGRNTTFLQYPSGLKWLPNIHREDYRSFGMYSTYAKGEATPIVQEMQKFGHLANLFNMCYDKGGRIVGLLEARLGEAAFHDFIRGVVKKYSYRILRVEDFRRELESYTGRSWEQFFHEWLYTKGMCDWAVAEVSLTKPPKCVTQPCSSCPLQRRLLLCRGAAPNEEAAQRASIEGRATNFPETVPPGYTRVRVVLEQRREIDEPTVLGFALPDCEGYPIRIPIVPNAEAYTLEEPKARIIPMAAYKGKGACVEVEVLLPAEPTQITADPDQLLADAEPANNHWHTSIRWRLTPAYSFLEETDLTNAYDRWNVIAGPWFFSSPYQDAWFTRSAMVGLRSGAYRTQQFNGGAYVGYRTDFRDVVAGVDGMWDHFPGGTWQTGFIAERRLSHDNQGDSTARRGVLWTRYIFTYGSSLYLPPIHYLEAFAQYSDNFLPFATQALPTGVRFDETTTLGLHYRLNYLTPYWDPEGGFQFDAWYEGGLAQLPNIVGVQKLSGQFSYVQTPPDLSSHAEGMPKVQAVLSWLSDWRIAVRAYGATAAPSRGEFFTMGGPGLFRGFDMAQRQGSSAWVTSVEARIPVARRVCVDAVDHVVGLRNFYVAGFYDVGNAYTRGKQVGPVAHAVGAGVRMDLSWISFVERTMLRLDVAKSVNSDTGVQVWLGINQPF